MYQVLRCGSLTQLENEVMAKMKKGFKLAGGVVFTGSNYLQAIYKETK